MSVFSKQDYALINLGVCIKQQAERLDVEHEGVPLEGVVVRIAEAAIAARREAIRLLTAESRLGVVAEEPEPSDQLKALLRDLTDPDNCSFDHHGGCQAHGYLSLQPGEKCPHAEAKELLASWVPVKQEGADDA